MKTQYFRHEEGTLAFSDYGGDGELVLMLPGMGALRSEYRFLAPKLTKAGFHAVTMDLRGQGESSVPWKIYDVTSVGNDALALIKYLGARAAHVVGTSFAAAPAVWAAAKQPDHIRSLVLIGASVSHGKLNPFMRALLWLMLNNPWRVQAWVKYYSMLYTTCKPADFEEYQNRLRRNLAEPGRFDAAIALGNSSREPSEESLDQVQAPTLVIMGTKDPDFPDPVAEGRSIAEQTGGQLELIEGAGHYAQTEMPERTCPIVIDFLKRSSSQLA